MDEGKKKELGLRKLSVVEDEEVDLEDLLKLTSVKKEEEEDVLIDGGPDGIPLKSLLEVVRSDAKDRYLSSLSGYLLFLVTICSLNVTLCLLSMCSLCIYFVFSQTGESTTLGNKTMPSSMRSPGVKLPVTSFALTLRVYPFVFVLKGFLESTERFAHLL